MKRPRQRAQPLRSPYVADCERHFSRLTSDIKQSWTMPSTREGRAEDPRGHAWLGPHARRASELGTGQIGVKPYRLDDSPDTDCRWQPLILLCAIFGEEMCNFRANRKMPQADILAHFAPFFRSDLTEFELTRRSMFFVPMLEKALKSLYRQCPRYAH